MRDSENYVSESGLSGLEEKLLPHQVDIFRGIISGKRIICAAPRTGKTRPVIAFLAEVKDVLVLTKKAAVGGWLSELKAMGVTGWTVTNYEQVRTKGWDAQKVWGALVLDECHALGSYPKPNLCVKPIWNLPVLGPRVGITATPCAESYSQLFFQSKALKLPIWREFKNFYHWFKVYGVPKSIRAHGRLVAVYDEVKQKAWEEFSKHCVIVDRAEVMPDFVESEDHVVELEAPEVLEMCGKLKRDGVIYVDGRAIVADSVLAMAQKCHQICCGVVLDDRGEPLVVNTVKRDWARRVFLGQKTAILTTFRAEVTLYGGDVALEAWQGTGGPDWFVGNIQRFCRGVDMSMADALVMTSCPWGAEAHQQGKDRLLRRDRVRSAPVYYPVIKGGIDALIYKRVALEKADFTAQQYERARNPSKRHQGT